MFFYVLIWVVVFGCYVFVCWGGYEYEWELFVVCGFYFGIELCVQFIYVCVCEYVVFVDGGYEYVVVFVLCEDVFVDCV